MIVILILMVIVIVIAVVIVYIKSLHSTMNRSAVMIITPTSEVPIEIIKNDRYFDMHR